MGTAELIRRTRKKSNLVPASATALVDPAGPFRLAPVNFDSSQKARDQQLGRRDQQQVFAEMAKVLNFLAQEFVNGLLHAKNPGSIVFDEVKINHRTRLQ